MNLTRHKLNIMAPDGASWSGKWRKAKRKYYKKHGKVCKCCGSKKNVELHHKLPRHLFPELALDEKNFIPLCNRKGVGCHFLLGHLQSYYTYNEKITEVAKFARENSVLKKNVA